MTELIEEYNNIKQLYREQFEKVALDVQSAIFSLKPPNLVQDDIFIPFKKQNNLDGVSWQKDVYKYLNNELNISKGQTQTLINSSKEKFSCNCCASCCNLAISEFSPQELKFKAQNGDNYSKQFLQVFIPYESTEQAKKLFPQYIELLEQTNNSEVYYYHCPKVTKDNKCSDYENRPQICKDFPDNPLAFLPTKCSYNKWLNDVREISIKQSAKTEIISFYLNKLSDLLE